VSNSTLYLYRVNEENQRQMWALEIDNQKTIVSETLVQDPTLPQPQSKDMGVTYETKPDGTRIITGIDDRTKQAMSFFTDAPCWFEGCEELRTQYKKDLEAQQSGTGCKTCKGAIYRKYIKKVTDAMPDQ